MKRTEECLLFPSGFAANLGTIPALADPSACEIFSDRLNHASIVDGCRLARSRGATITIYEHNDVGDLRTKLLRSNAKRKLIVTDALFSVDGDWAPLRALACLKRDVGGRDGDVMLLVDEAHATLVCGTTGGGAVEMFLKDNASPGGLLSAGHRDTDRGTKHENEKEDLSYLVDAHVGTLSKAFGSHGGFVCVSRALKSVLLSTTRTAVFSTALPAPCVAAACASLRVAGVDEATGADEATAADEGRVLREKVWRHVRRANDALRGAAFFAEPPNRMTTKTKTKKPQERQPRNQTDRDAVCDTTTEQGSSARGFSPKRTDRQSYFLRRVRKRIRRVERRRAFIANGAPRAGDPAAHRASRHEPRSHRALRRAQRRGHRRAHRRAH